MRKSLFSYTRKRVYDQLLLQTLGFCVKQNVTRSDSITFEFSGNRRLNIRDFGDGVVISHWFTFAREKQETEHYSDRRTINARIAEIIGGAK